MILNPDQTVGLNILGTIAQDFKYTLNGVTITVSLKASGGWNASDNNPLVLDESYNTVEVDDDTWTGGTLTLSDPAATISNEYAVVGPVIFSTNGTSVVGYDVSFDFIITSGNIPVYIDSDPFAALSPVFVGAGTVFGFQLNGTTANPPVGANDGPGYFAVPPGSTRSFTYRGVISRADNTTGLASITVLGVRYGLTTIDMTSQSFGSSNLDVTVQF